MGSLWNLSSLSGPVAVKVLSGLDHWTAREFPIRHFFSLLVFISVLPLFLRNQKVFPSLL